MVVKNLYQYTIYFETEKDEKIATEKKVKWHPVTVFLHVSPFSVYSRYKRHTDPAPMQGCSCMYFYNTYLYLRSVFIETTNLVEKLCVAKEPRKITVGIVVHQHSSVIYLWQASRESRRENEISKEERSRLDLAVSGN